MALNSAYIALFGAKKSDMGEKGYDRAFQLRKENDSEGIFKKDRGNTVTELTIKIPDKLHRIACEVSEKNNIPVDEIIAASLAQHLFRIIPDPYLEERAARATGEGFSYVLSRVPDVPPDDYDRL